MIEALRKAQEAASTATFGLTEEEAIVSIALDLPDFFLSVAQFLKPDLFARAETRYIMTMLLNYIEEHAIAPTRGLLWDVIANHLTVDDPFEDVRKIVYRPSNPREVPGIKKRLLEWAKSKAYGLLYSQDAVTAYNQGDYAYLEGLVEQANRILDVSSSGFWFFKQTNELFREDLVIHYSTGWSRLDAKLKNGGPSPGEVVLFLAATNTGKSIILKNVAANSVMNGYDTLFVSLEDPIQDAALGCMGALTGRSIARRHEYRDSILDHCAKVRKTHDAELVLFELPPEECSTDHIDSIISQLQRTRNWRPKIVCIDYLELLLSRREAYNRNDYTRQKHVAVEMIALAKKNQALIYSATQTNRAGALRADTRGNNAPIDLDKAAESFGKMMPVPYVISLNQSEQEYKLEQPVMRAFIAKNRGGPKFETINLNVNYDTLKITQQLID